MENPWDVSTQLKRLNILPNICLINYVQNTAKIKSTAWNFDPIILSCVLITQSKHLYYRKSRVYCTSVVSKALALIVVKLSKKYMLGLWPFFHRLVKVKLAICSNSLSSITQLNVTLCIQSKLIEQCYVPG